MHSRILNAQDTDFMFDHPALPQPMLYDHSNNVVIISKRYLLSNRLVRTLKYMCELLQAQLNIRMVAQSRVLDCAANPLIEPRAYSLSTTHEVCVTKHSQVHRCSQRAHINQAHICEINLLCLQ
ncbi:hypothetical protein AF72_06600 [Xylella taiwanensis]|uniref:Uncharacterized protein n=1 Tax=Xylella taiwanensis TaxID=1444770 RepID=Z9JJL1_9GAMM|nr:hypothetical protein AB672_07525 [Xylella taiwanensis]EWS78168.1 hypothetical protein AF72_06600 [Xylella taiwanensis]